jgi:hypothetical protein
MLRLFILLSYLDSNQDKLNQNQLYCHYTIGHRNWDGEISTFSFFAKKSFTSSPYLFSERPRPE